ncbi:hypothetical protein RHMOL_Rhmol06G0108100 [Rhododendron molle]|uniref:Uncharacterized protein n=1 Tax=Rhododendron molle TaxID=49168 RepID=A0ACC0NC41_RHOML|nr:hypothetical protein RHMOL_Rhmol06G0108100 [Rhododendron molle]
METMSCLPQKPDPVPPPLKAWSKLWLKTKLQSSLPKQPLPTNPKSQPNKTLLSQTLNLSPLRPDSPPNPFQTPQISKEFKFPRLQSLVKPPGPPHTIHKAFRLGVPRVEPVIRLIPKPNPR